MKNLVEKWSEFVNDERFADTNGFEVKDEFDQRVWPKEDAINPFIKDRLLQIAKNFFSKLDVDDVEIIDIVLTGSLANYNWSKYSDLDVHIIIDFDDVDANTELVRDYFQSKKSIWNNNHAIKLLGYEVEIYVENEGDPHTSTGVYSLLQDKWLVKPYKAKPKIDWAGVYKKAAFIADQIDKVSETFDKGKYRKAYKMAENLKEKIRKFRKCGLDTGGQYSSENLAFKLLRRSDYLGTISSLKIVAYDRMMSMKNGESQDTNRVNLTQNWNDFLNEAKSKK